MTYQFDPRPEGLHYEPFTAPMCRKTMWYLIDPAPEPWVDLRSVFEALGMSWARKWRMYCLARQRLWALEACCDHERRETLLAPASKIPAVLGEVSALLSPWDGARTRVRDLRLAWRSIADEVFTGTVKSWKPAPGMPKVRPRKVTPFIVRQIFVLLEKGHNKPAIAQALGISRAAVQQVAAGTYKLSPDALEAWSETFGASKAVAEPN